MEFIYTAFRLIGLYLGYPLQLIFFKRRTFFESDRRTNRRALMKGGKLIIANHYNMLDYVMASFLVLPRKLNVVTSEHPFTIPFFRFGMKFFGAIQANRVTKNMRFMDICADTIKKGQLVEIFPEGRNTPDGNIHEFKHSYIVIAYRAGAPIIPVVSDGNYGLFRRTNVIVGDEIDISRFVTSGKRTPTKEELAAINDHVFSKVLELRQELERRKAGEKCSKK